MPTAEIPHSFPVQAAAEKDAEAPQACCYARARFERTEGKIQDNYPDSWNAGSDTGLSPPLLCPLTYEELLRMPK